MEASPSRTAVLAAVARGTHRFEEAPPWVLDDPFALVLVGRTWPETSELVSSLFPLEVLREARGFIAMRSRYAEDCLCARRFSQYVMLGAGLDSFAWRRPDLSRSLMIFEVDHAASQAWKLQRAKELALPIIDSHTFVSVDFEVESLHDRLKEAGLDWTAPTMFSWLAVAPYLTTEAIQATLRTIATAGSGSEIVFSYRSATSVLDDNGRKFFEIFSPLAAAAGEPLQPGWSVVDIERLIEGCGLKVAEHPTRAELTERYFGNRTDGLVPYSAESLVAATLE
jgi:methyltransferase (TIGR00027 family)